MPCFFSPVVYPEAQDYSVTISNLQIVDRVSIGKAKKPKHMNLIELNNLLKEKEEDFKRWFQREKKVNSNLSLKDITAEEQLANLKDIHEVKQYIKLRSQDK